MSRSHSPQLGQAVSSQLPPSHDIPYSQPMPREQLLDFPLHLSPAGRFRLGAALGAGSSAFLDAVKEAFRAGEEEGLFKLAVRPPDGELSPLLGYWRDFAARYPIERCHSPVDQAILESLAPLPSKRPEVFSRRLRRWKGLSLSPPTASNACGPRSMPSTKSAPSSPRGMSASPPPRLSEKRWVRNCSGLHVLQYLSADFEG